MVNEFQTLSFLFSAGDSGRNCRFRSAPWAAEQLFSACASWESHHLASVLRRRQHGVDRVRERDTRYTLLRRRRFQRQQTPARLGRPARKMPTSCASTIQTFTCDVVLTLWEVFDFVNRDHSWPSALPKSDVYSNLAGVPEYHQRLRIFQ